MGSEAGVVGNAVEVRLSCVLAAFDWPWPLEIAWKQVIKVISWGSYACLSDLHQTAGLLATLLIRGTCFEPPAGH